VRFEAHNYQTQRRSTREEGPYLEEASIKLRDHKGDRADRYRPNIDAFEPLFVVNVPLLGPLKMWHVELKSSPPKVEAPTYIFSFIKRSA
jgi:hypothetical protein